MKGNTHFIVFGVCVVIGAVLAFIGASSKSQASENIATQSASLPNAATLPTKGDLAQAEKQRALYNKSLVSAQKTLESLGDKLTAGLPDAPSAMQFYSRQGEASIRKLKERADALVRTPEYPKWVEVKAKKSGSRAVKSDSETTPFADLEKEALGLSNDEEVRPFQIRLRVIAEFLTVAEGLLKTEHFSGGTGLRITKIEFPSKDSGGKSSKNSPYIRYPFVFEFDADPSLATAIMDELLNPSDLMAKSGQKDADGNLVDPRTYFPVSLVSYSAKQAKRPLAVSLKLSKDEAIELGLNPDVVNYDVLNDNDSDNDEWENEMKKLAKHKTIKAIRLRLPMRCELSLEALQWNPNWLAVKNPEQ